jgi:hypothetical protein
MILETLSRLLVLVSKALVGQKSDEDVARELIDAAFDSGVPAALLLEHLTEKGRQRAELAADLAQWAKTSAP